MNFMNVDAYIPNLLVTTGFNYKNHYIEITMDIQSIGTSPLDESYNKTKVTLKSIDSNNEKNAKLGHNAKTYFATDEFKTVEQAIEFIDGLKSKIENSLLMGTIDEVTTCRYEIVLDYNTQKEIVRYTDGVELYYTTMDKLVPYEEKS